MPSSKFKLFLLLLMLVFVNVMSAQAQPNVDSFSMKELVDSLGRISADTLNHDILYRLEKNIDSAFVLLIKDLKTTKVKKLLNDDQGLLKNKETMHTIWCLRALKYLTGQEFSANTKHVFKKSEELWKYWTSLKAPLGKYTFFGVWMSRNSIYIAPIDVQRSVIRQWKAWLGKNSHGFKRSQELEFNEWFF